MTLSDDIKSLWKSPRGVKEQLGLINLAMSEDQVDGDWATQALFTEKNPLCEAEIIAKESGVLCGGIFAANCIRNLDEKTEILHLEEESQEVKAGQLIMKARARISAVLGAERTALNLLSHLSGIATQTRNCVDQLPRQIALLDTRKTLPGIRWFQKLAVRCGGGVNHRFDLSEFPMIKENHRDLFRRLHWGEGAQVDAATEISELVSRIRSCDSRGKKPLEIEVEDYASFLACLENQVDYILVDNKTPTELRSWIQRAEKEIGAGWHSKIEASGGISPETLSTYGDSPADRVSMGALTHSVRALDFSLYVDWPKA